MLYFEWVCKHRLCLSSSAFDSRARCTGIVWVKVKVTQSCPDSLQPCGYTVHGILQARILEWAAFPFSRGSSQPRDWTQVSSTAGGIFTSWATREAQSKSKNVSLFHMKSESEVTQSCPTLCDPMDFSPRNFPDKSTGVGCHFLLQGNLPDPGIKPVSSVAPALQAGSLPAEP